MITPRKKVGGKQRKRAPIINRPIRPTLEVLEERCLLSAPAWPNWVVAQPAQAAIVTLDAAQSLSFVVNPASAAQIAAGATGAIVNQAGAGEANWYTFTLTQASDVQLSTLDTPGGNHLASVLSLFNTEAIDYSNPPLSYIAPPYDLQQHRLLTQVDAGVGGAGEYIDRQLAAGTYYVAVTGQGNDYFNPFLADSGNAGGAGAYRLLVTANALPIASSDGPTVLAVDSGLLNGPGLLPLQTGIPVLSSSPLALYIDFSSPIDPGTVSLQQALNDGSSVQLTYNLTGQFGNENDSPVILNGFHYAADTMELELQLAAPLRPGSYQLTLAGNSSSGNQVLTDSTFTYDLGQNSVNPLGQDFSTTFAIAGSAASDDTAATAHNLANITQKGLVQAVGAIGDDPAYNPLNPTAPSLANPASQVDLYHFQISGPGIYDLGAEVFAGRIGSTLDAALSLFGVDASNSQSPLQLVASNDNSGNPTVSSNGQLTPLFTDSVLDIGLTAGDYYLAVSSSGNMPDFNGNSPGTNDVFDPNVSHSGFNGSSTGNYVLNLLVQPAAPAPQVLSTSVSPGATLKAAPTQLTVTFDSYVNVTVLANQAFDTTSESTVSGVFFVEPDGQRVFPRLQSYNAATNQATFLMLDRLPNGLNTLHLSGANGLTGFGGVPLVGNDPSGDYVVSFTVADPAAPADPLNRTEQTSNPAPGEVQTLGVLFPHEIQSEVDVTGALAASASGVTPEADSYSFQVLESQEYHFTLTGPPAYPGGPPTQPGNVQFTITGVPQTDPDLLKAILGPGLYTLQISRSSADTTVSVPYQLHITMLSVPENPPPLPFGTAPVLQIRTLNNPLLPPEPPASVGPVPTTTSENLLAALAVRTELVGGVTDTTTGSSLAFAAAPQVQGLNSGPGYISSSLPAVRLAFLSLLLVDTSSSVSELSSPEGTPVMDSVWASAREWLASLKLGLELLSRPASPLNEVLQGDSAPTNRPPPEALLGPQILDLPSPSSGISNALADRVSPREGSDGSSQPVSSWSQGTATEIPEEEAIASDPNAGSRTSLTGIAVTGGIALAALLIRMARKRPDLPSTHKEQTPAWPVGSPEELAFFEKAGQTIKVQEGRE